MVPPFLEDTAAWRADVDLAAHGHMCAAMLRALAEQWDFRIQAGRLGPHLLEDAHGLARALESAAEALDPRHGPPAGPSAQRSARTLLRESEERLRLLIDSVRDYAIFLLSPDGRVMTWNVGAERIKGYFAEEVVGRHFSMFYPPESVEAGRPEVVLETAARAGRYEEEGWRVRKGGSRFWAHVTVTALRDETGALRGFAKVTRDLTERRAASDLLQQSEERFRLMVESVVDYAIFMLHRDGTVASWNAGAERIKGYTAPEIVGRHVSAFYPPELVASGHAERALAVAARDGRFQEEGWRVRKGGARFWASVTISAVRDPTGLLLGFCKVTRDMTERKEREDLLRATAETLGQRTTALEAANRELESFAWTVSHDLRAPLRSIAGNATLLVDGEPLSEEAVRRLGRIRESTDRMARLIDDLLRFARSGAGPLQPGPIDISALAEEIAAELAEREPERVVRFACPPGTYAFGDRGLVRIVLANLLENAWKYTRDAAAPAITVLPFARGALRGFRVRDNGVGFEMAQAEEVFRPFARLPTAFEGHGLGLATVRRIVERHGGAVWAESAPGRGSSFHVVLPDGPVG